MSATHTQFRRPRLPLYMKKRRNWQPVALTLIVVMLIASGILYYLAGRHQRSSAMLEPGKRYITYQSAYGQRKAVKLPDSTLVILNSRSKLYMPESFPQNRTLVLDGEAFFSVPSAGQEMVILTDKLKTRTPGATFRLRSLESQSGAYCLVLNGQAHVGKSYYSPTDNATEDLSAGESVLANKGIDLMEKETFELSEQEECLEGKLVFNNTPLPAAFKKMEDWFGVEMEMKGRARSESVTGVFNPQSVEDLLTVLGDSIGFTYRVTRDKVVIKF